MTVLFHVWLQNPSLKVDLHGVSKIQSFKLSKEQREVLKEVYRNNPFPSPEFIRKLSKDFNIDSFKVFKWFRTRRYKERFGRKLLCVLFSSGLLYPYTTA